MDSKIIYWKLHGLFFLYAFAGVLEKAAAGGQFLSMRFCLFYTAAMMLLAFYAFMWQQMIKKLPLITAYANKAVTVLWSMMWGVLLFRESVTVGKAVGVIFVVSGIILFADSTDGRRND